MIQARTAYGVPIYAKAFADIHGAIMWAEKVGARMFPGLTIVRVDAKGRARKVWQEVGK